MMKIKLTYMERILLILKAFNGYGLYDSLAKSIHDELCVFDENIRIDDNIDLLRNIAMTAANAFIICDKIKKTSPNSHGGIEASRNIASLMGMFIPCTYINAKNKLKGHSVAINPQSEVLLTYDKGEMSHEADRVIIIKKKENTYEALMTNFKDDYTRGYEYYGLKDKLPKDSDLLRENIYGIDNIAKRILELYAKKMHICKAINDSKR